MATTEKETGTEGAFPRRDRLGLRHCLVWVLGCALGFAAYRGMMPPRFMPMMKIRVLSGAYNLSMGCAFGTMLMGTGVLAHRRLRGDASCPGLPGHWLLVFGVTAALADATGVVVFRGLYAAWFPPDAHLWAYWLPYRMARNPDLAGMYSQCAGWGVGAVAALAFCWHLRRRVPWSWYTVFLAFLLTAVVLALGSITVTALFHGPARWGPAIVWYRSAIHVFAGLVLLDALMILAAIARDHACRRRADGLHWAGVASWLTVASMQLIAYSLLRR